MIAPYTVQWQPSPCHSRIDQTRHLFPPVGYRCEGRRGPSPFRTTSGEKGGAVRGQGRALPSREKAEGPEHPLSSALRMPPQGFRAEGIHSRLERLHLFILLN